MKANENNSSYIITDLHVSPQELQLSFVQVSPDPWIHSPSPHLWKQWETLEAVLWKTSHNCIITVMVQHPIQMTGLKEKNRMKLGISGECFNSITQLPCHSHYLHLHRIRYEMSTKSELQTQINILKVIKIVGESDMAPMTNFSFPFKTHIL